MNKDSDTDWFTIQPEDGGKAWKGKCWCATLSMAAAVLPLMAMPARVPAQHHHTSNLMTGCNLWRSCSTASGWCLMPFPKESACKHTLLSSVLVRCAQVRAQLHQVRV
eukprot:GHRQ01023764.1.p1 GENE.GHRQ01023764.1~~GHRQ01023764.1.p1  ORF type:complete len:108 (-),score=18.72 GHRQ01023764.1:461-784(-)